MKKILLASILLVVSLSLPVYAFDPLTVCAGGVVESGGGCSGWYGEDDTAGAGNSSGTIIRCDTITIDCADTFTSMRAYLSGLTSDSREFSYAIYDDDGTDGAPKTRLGYTAAHYTGNAGPEWVEISFSSGISLDNETVYGCKWSESVFGNFYYDTASGTDYYYTDTSPTGFPTWPADIESQLTKAGLQTRQDLQQITSD